MIRTLQQQAQERRRASACPRSRVTQLARDPTAWIELHERHRLIQNSAHLPFTRRLCRSMKRARPAKPARSVRERAAPRSRARALQPRGRRRDAACEADGEGLRRSDTTKMKIYDGLKIHPRGDRCELVDPTGTHGYEGPRRDGYRDRERPGDRRRARGSPVGDTIASSTNATAEELQSVPVAASGTFVVTYGNKATSCGERRHGDPDRGGHAAESLLWIKPCKRYWQQRRARARCARSASSTACARSSAPTTPRSSCATRILRGE